MRLRQWFSDNDLGRDMVDWAWNKSADEAYRQCDKSSWLLRWAMKAGVDFRKTTLCYCDIARRSTKGFESSVGFEEMIEAIDSAERWCVDDSIIERPPACVHSVISRGIYASCDSFADFSTPEFRSENCDVVRRTIGLDDYLDAMGLDGDTNESR